MAADHSETTITYTQQYRSGLASKQQKFKDGYINRGTGRMRGIIHRFNYFQLSQGFAKTHMMDFLIDLMRTSVVIEKREVKRPQRHM